MTPSACSICHGTVHTELGHGFVCEVCGGVTCGNCFSAIPAPHVGGRHQVGTVACTTCREEGERSGHVQRMRAKFLHYENQHRYGMEAWRTEMRKAKHERRHTEEIFGDARAREENRAP